MNNIDSIYCFVDDFVKQFLANIKRRSLTADSSSGKEASSLSLSEIIAILIYFHVLRFRDFKAYYLNYVLKYMWKEFPGLVSYNRFVELMPSAILPLANFIFYNRGEKTGIYFIDSTSIKVCHSKRGNSNKVFGKTAKKGKTTKGWFYGFKLHLVINDKGELMSFCITQGNVDDRKPILGLCKGLKGKIFGDRGYISEDLANNLLKRGLNLITKIKKNMKNKLMPIIDKILLRKRAVIESVYDLLKNIFQIEHTRHRSKNNFLVNLLSGLAAYVLTPKKPSLGIKQCQLVKL